MAKKKAAKKKAVKKKAVKKTVVDTLDGVGEPPVITPMPRLGDAEDFKKMAEAQILGDQGFTEPTVSDAGQPFREPASPNVQETMSLELLTALWQRPFDMAALVLNNTHIKIDEHEALELAKPTKVLCDLYMPEVDPKQLAVGTLIMAFLTIAGSRVMLWNAIQKDAARGGPGPAAHAVPHGPDQSGMPSGFKAVDVK